MLGYSTLNAWDVQRVLSVNNDFVTLSIDLLEVAGRAEADKLTVYHDSDLVTERLCLVHAVSCQED